MELIKNDIEILKDPSKKAKIEEEEKINIETRNKEVEKKAQIGPIMTLAKPTTPPTST